MVDWVPLISRWIHIVGAVTFVGGTIYMYLSVRGALNTVQDADARENLRTELMSRWKHIVALTFVMLFGSGFYNYLMVTRHVHEDQGAYHGLFGAKFLIALVAFVLVFIVTSTMAWSEKMREKPLFWHLAVLTSLAVVLIAGYMKMMPTS